jgi:hypothetical protein
VLVVDWHARKVAASELRGLLKNYADLMGRIHDAEQVQAFQESVLDAIREASPEVAAAVIAQAARAPEHPQGRPARSLTVGCCRSCPSTSGTRCSAVTSTAASKSSSRLARAGSRPCRRAAPVSADPDWYEVHATFHVRAHSEDDAIAVISNAVRDRQHPGRGMAVVYPVGGFRAHPTEDLTAGPGRGPAVVCEQLAREVLTEASTHALTALQQLVIYIDGWRDTSDDALPSDWRVRFETDTPALRDARQVLRRGRP